MMMFADRLRNITNNRISRNEIQQKKTEFIDFLNDNTGINEINRKLEETATSIFNIIEDQQLADTTSHTYYRMVINAERSTDQLRNEAQEHVTRLENVETVDDHNDDEYRATFSLLTL